MFTGGVADPQTKTINLSAENISYEISDNLYGIFLEDISFSGDGGLVSNLVNNNSFEYEAKPDAAWQVDAVDYAVLTADGLNENNTNYLSVTVEESATVKNLGFTELYDYKTYNPDSKKQSTADMGFKAGEEYTFSAYFKNVDFEGTVKVSLNAKGNKDFYEFDISACTDWTKITLPISSDVTADGSLLLTFTGNGSFYMDFVSLVPTSSHGYGTDEWKYTTLRTDLYDALKGLSPQFIRFPGGCLAEGDSLETIYNWKNTIGKPEERLQTYNLWADDNNGRYYVNTNSLGFHEYFTLCAELGAEPVPVLNAGLICQGRAGYNDTLQKYNNGEITEAEWQEYVENIAYTPETDEFNQYLQDIFDLIEYANGDVTTEWGALRAENGHAEPFNMKYLAIGNENWGEIYWRNFDAVYKAVKEKYPEITIISSAGHSGSGEDFDANWATINANYRDTIVDEHYYTVGGYLFGTTDRYDTYERSSAKVIVGEYAPKADGVGTIQTKSNIWAAIENAAYLTGIERNADVVSMISYAPALAKINAQCWDVNLIWFDSQNVVFTPDYYVQMLFANNYGTNYLNTDFDMTDEGVYQCSTVDTENQVIYVKLVNSTNIDHKIDINLTGFENVNNPSVQYLDENFKAACNEIDEPLHVAPKEASIEVSDNTISYVAGSYSVSVIRIPYGENDGTELYKLPLYEAATPYLPDWIWVTISAIMVAFVLGTGAVILGVRIKHHKEIREDK